jgi:hypothetical protein
LHLLYGQVAPELQVDRRGVTFLVDHDRVYRRQRLKGGSNALGARLASRLGHDKADLLHAENSSDVQVAPVLDASSALAGDLW